jgi:hypothetical protein
MATTQLIPVTALQFKQGSIASRGLNFMMTAYGGGIIKNHWYWGNLAIDLSRIAFPKNTYPLLENHDTDKRIGHFSRDQIEIDGGLRIKGLSYVDTPESHSFRKLSREGFPFEASIRALPTQIQRLTEGETATVNGFEFKGPGTVWRACEFKEASVCVFGWDTDTQATASSQSGDRLTLPIEDFTDDEDKRWIAHMLSLINGKRWVKHSLADDEDGQAIKHMLSLCGQAVEQKEVV